MILVKKWNSVKKSGEKINNKEGLIIHIWYNMISKIKPTQEEVEIALKYIYSPIGMTSMLFNSIGEITDYHKKMLKKAFELVKEGNNNFDFRFDYLDKEEMEELQKVTTVEVELRDGEKYGQL